jgi:hypothetical protein
MPTKEWTPPFGQLNAAKDVTKMASLDAVTSSIQVKNQQ